MYRPAAPKELADVVNLGYVVNVVEDPSERAETLRKAWEPVGAPSWLREVLLRAAARTRSNSATVS